MNRWVEAARPRTLPLAIASTILGNILAYVDGHFLWTIGALAILTTLLLQILSNFANDLGDTQNGIDNADRKVALRAVQTGAISPSEMKKAVYISALLAFISGISLLYISLQTASIEIILGFLVLGILAIAAAIAYTVGKRPYGYMGLGDLSVFLFFGLVGTVGVYFLQTLEFKFVTFLPAAGCGFMSVAVLNLNNLRDLENDKKQGKLSIPVRIGKTAGFLYQKFLYILTILSFGLFPMLNHGTPPTLMQSSTMLAAFIPIALLANKLQPSLTPAQIDPYLKKTALITLWLILVFGFTQIFLSE
ncbi:1,4-dihydroxy-2-naphthoate octaprenyltransferase [Aquirufa nivalisilvae]|uniref:1,4-dihydroxy-2-naphthoate octaprenyltransferase n=1 Tax=Aquirufa nivalisilvae TaxID=2516557 RepID=A0A2S2DVZ5_9BACT|nr:1,4-dihydroxy-2-naphthoate octaprenyltransferase [Aquirufa nivalisilvae]AWL09555.1 1,4-dihydroxy-2-naphthoate octaprenyltransferase [Aquirufa nivalisilvae]